MAAATVPRFWLELWERAWGFMRLIGELGVRVCASMPLFGNTPVASLNPWSDLSNCEHLLPESCHVTAGRGQGCSQMSPRCGWERCWWCSSNGQWRFRCLCLCVLLPAGKRPNWKPRLVAELAVCVSVCCCPPAGGQIARHNLSPCWLSVSLCVVARWPAARLEGTFGRRVG